MLSKRAAFTKSAASFGGLSRGGRPATRASAGRLFVISASSGTGKTTLANELLKEDSRLVRSVSCTTRPPRAGETEGEHYYFISKNEFLEKKKKREFLEWANVFGRYYGTPKQKVESLLRQGKDVLLVIDVQGAKQVKKTRPDAVFIFLAPPSKEELKRRLEKRGTESREEINRRYRVATKELQELNDLKLCDYRIVNRDIGTCYQALKAILEAERGRDGR
ncbi:MAG: guanylate kinase [Candidatus Omnitrophica bacterium]|nr:guanylate kinase [Candidatus Omnitrophota bacterium]